MEGIRVRLAAGAKSLVALSSAAFVIRALAVRTPRRFSARDRTTAVLSCMANTRGTGRSEHSTGLLSSSANPAMKVSSSCLPTDRGVEKGDKKDGRRGDVIN
jgi:hypothetical protein